MNFLLGKKYKYIVLAPIESVRSQLKSIFNIPWYDIAINISGKIAEDNTFKVYTKFSFWGVQVFGIIRSVAMISGKLEPANGQTTIIAEVKPTNSLLLAFYLMLLISLLRLLGLFTSSTENDWIEIIGLFIIVILIRGLIHISMGRLKNRFERIMSIHPED